MSGEGQESVASSGNSWDYRDHPVVAPETTPETEVEVTENKAGEAQSGSEDPQTEEDKPWKAENSETPGWARKRFREYSSTVRALKEQNQQLMGTVKEILGTIKPGAKEMKEGDFNSPEEFREWERANMAQKIKSEVQQELQEKLSKEQEFQQKQSVESRNVQAAKQDLPDYDEAISMGDPEIRLPVSVADHLSISPAGPYVKYRLATDDGLADRIKKAKPEEKIALISELHDNVLDYLIKKSGGAEAQVAPETPLASTEVQPVGVRTSTPPRKGPPAPPKAPPSVRGKGDHRDIMSLSGDEYARARREMMSK